ncbi:hypothetical protein KC351_g14 [Hortaea werneckii]|nr:hypothetical protein KC351_g14 [Hortaea werneckii]
MQGPVAQAVAILTAAQLVLEMALSLPFLLYCFRLRQISGVVGKARQLAGGPCPECSEREKDHCVGPLPLPHSLIAQADSASWVGSCWKICVRRCRSSGRVVVVVIARGIASDSMVLQTVSCWNALGGWDDVEPASGPKMEGADGGSPNDVCSFGEFGAVSAKGFLGFEGS